jgi:hypothetical protein
MDNVFPMDMFATKLSNVDTSSKLWFPRPDASKKRESRDSKRNDLFTSKKNFFLILESKHKKRLDHAG